MRYDYVKGHNHRNRVFVLVTSLVWISHYIYCMRYLDFIIKILFVRFQARPYCERLSSTSVVIIHLIIIDYCILCTLFWYFREMPNAVCTCIICVIIIWKCLNFVMIIWELLNFCNVNFTTVFLLYLFQRAVGSSLVLVFFFVFVFLFLYHHATLMK